MFEMTIPTMQEAAMQRRITQFAFFSRLGDDLTAQLDLMAMDNPAGTQAERFVQAKLRARMARLRSAQFIDLDLPELRDGFVALLPADSLAQVFDAAVLEHELP